VLEKPEPELMAELSGSFTRATGFFFAAPEYNGSIPPTLSNAIAWLSTETQDFRAVFNHKPAVIATHSGGGGQKLLTSLRIQLSHLGVNVLGRELSSKGDGEVRESSLNDALQRLLSLANI
jgi:NAD(P)H-dependent FMN reductase